MKINSITSDSASQEHRWTNFVDKWGEVLDTYQEVVVTGDINIDLGQNVQSHLHASLYDILNRKILTRGYNNW